MNRKLITTVLVSGLTFSVYLATGGTVQEQVDFLADAGIAAANRDATCPVRLDPDFAADAGLSIYQRLKFPVRVATLPDGGRDVQLPPMPLGKVRDAIDVVSWDDCTLVASTAPVAALWGNRLPFQLVPAASKPWCRAKFDAGLDCLLLDGGTFGDRNVSACSTRANPATCERVSSGVIYAGDDPEEL